MFWGEVLTLLGTWQGPNTEGMGLGAAGPWLALAAALGALLAAGRLFRVLYLIWHGQAPALEAVSTAHAQATSGNASAGPTSAVLSGAPHSAPDAGKDLSRVELTVLAPLVVATIGFGVQPWLLLLLTGPGGAHVGGGLVNLSALEVQAVDWVAIAPLAIVTVTMLAVLVLQAVWPGRRRLLDAIPLGGLGLAAIALTPLARGELHQTFCLVGGCSFYAARDTLGLQVTVILAAAVTVLLARGERSLAAGPVQPVLACEASSSKTTLPAKPGPLPPTRHCPSTRRFPPGCCLARTQISFPGPSRAQIPCNAPK